MAVSLASVQAQLHAAADPEAKAATMRFVPTSQMVYGVRVPVLNALVKTCRAEGFALIEALWRAGAFEERLLASKLLGVIARRDPARTLDFVRAVSKDLSDWAVCDTLGTQGVRSIAKPHRTAIFAIAQELTGSRHLWERRLAVVLLLNFAKIGTERARIRTILAPLRADPEPYIQKALRWIDKDLNAR